jgi:hypothetical protein
MSMHCPVCGQMAHVRTSRPLSETVREQYLHCTNERCQTVFKGLVEVSTIVGPSLLPPDEQSPVSRRLPRSARTHPPPSLPGQLTLPDIPAPPG